MEIAEKISSLVCEKIRTAIIDSNGREIFFVGHSDENGIVSQGEVFARGTFDCVPVNKAAVRGQRGLQVLIHNHPSGNLEPSDADLAVASQAADVGQGFYIVNNDVTDIYAVVEPVIPGEKKKLDGEKLAELISYGGSLEKISENFEEREGQIALLKEICKVFNSDGVGIFEAGTGVGKSFAYLLPAITFALENNVRVVVSTGTINLQQQIIDKDIPLAQKILGKDVKAILVKGRQNFLCKRRLHEALNEKDLFNDEKEDLQEIAKWAESSPSGSKSDMTFFPSEMAWGKVCSEADACLFLKCPHHSECFVMKMRREAAASQILVVNHHLLFADLQARVNGMGYKDAAVLPPYQHIVFDEAHDMENAATGFFSERLTKFSLTKQLSILHRTKKSSVAGHLQTVCAMSSRGNTFDVAVKSINAIKSLYEETDKVALDLFPVEGTFRMKAENAVKARPLCEKMAGLSGKITALVNLLREILDDLNEEYATENCVWETKKVVQRLEGMASFCKNFSKFSEEENEVFWCEKRKSRGGDFYTSFAITPLDLSRFMNEALFSPFDAIICTSATLQIASSFDHWKQRIGLMPKIHSLFKDEVKIDKEIFEKQFPSPFDYKKNVLFCIPADIPFPTEKDFNAAVSQALISLIRAAEGRTLVLFTAYGQLRECCSAVREGLADDDYPVLCQNDDDRHRLLESFRENEKSVLFGTDSFWQGVDVPGKSLSQVIIVKLPFPVPSDPVFSARSDMIEKAGGNSFMELSIPDAAIKFKQGFGRLMRCGSDVGCVVALDRRITEKFYGEVFLRSLPETAQCFKTLDGVEDRICQWLN